VGTGAEAVLRHRAGLGSIALAALLWSTGGLLIKWAALPPASIMAIRAGFAALLFLVVFRRKVFILTQGIFLASCFYAFLVGSFVFATKLTTAANAIFLQYTAPIYLIILEPWLFRYRISQANLFTAILCLGGMGLFFIDDFSAGGLLGNILSLLSGMALAGMMLTQRKNLPQHQEASIFWGNVWVVLAGAPLALAGPTPGWQDWGILAFLGLVQIGLGYILFTRGLKEVTALESSLVAMLEPVLNPVWVWVGYGETPGSFAMLGGSIILLALVFRVVFTSRMAA